MSPVAGPAAASPDRGPAPRPTVTGILRRHAAAYVRRYPRQAAPQVRNILARLSLCRTRALGGHRFECRQCGHEANVYNSCTDRHCPQCSGARRRDWLNATATLLLPDVNYFQVVFTLPRQLSAVALGNRREVYDLLFHAAWAALRNLLREVSGIEAAAVMVLHTWDQRLQHHAHLHALVPGGGPALTEQRWIKTKHPRHRRRRKPYLVNNELLGQGFREAFLAGIKRLHRRGELKLNGEYSRWRQRQAFEADVDAIAPDGWVVFVEGPPHENARPEHVLKYLARYMTGGPISDGRLISHDGRLVRFWARSKEKSAAGERPPLVREKLPAVEFTRRWALHILPKHFTKVRRYGGYSNVRCRDYLERCRQLLGMTSHPAVDSSDQAKSSELPPAATDHTSTNPECPHCRQPMICLLAIERPSWLITMHSGYRPPWYHDD